MHRMPRAGHTEASSVRLLPVGAHIHVRKVFRTGMMGDRARGFARACIRASRARREVVSVCRAGTTAPIEGSFDTRWGGRYSLTQLLVGRRAINAIRASSSEGTAVGGVVHAELPLCCSVRTQVSYVALHIALSQDGIFVRARARV